MKQTVGDLALFGGRPAFEQPLHVGRPNVGDRARLMARLTEIVDNRWLTNAGPFVKEFERRVAAMMGVRHCVAVCNATVGLEIAIRAAGLSGDVIIPSFTFIATAHALQWQELTPVFCDIDPKTHMIDPNRIEGMITPRTSAIIGVHLWGRPCAVEALDIIARRHKLALLYDAAHAFGCTHRGRPIGTFGVAAIMSFHATKVVNAAEGGAILTDDDDLARKARLMKNFGFAGLDDVIYVATNGKMSELSAAFGLTNLESMEEFIAANRSNYECYGQGLAELSGVSLLRVEGDSTDRRNFQYIVVEIDQREAGLCRDDLVRILTAENVLARRYFWPGCHRMEPYRSLFPHAGLLLPETDRLAARVMVLPTGTAISRREVHMICELIRFAIANHAEIADSLHDTAPDA